MASRLCDSCKSTMATLFCRADTSFLCVNCDTKIHAVNKLASRHARVLVCEVCVQAPAHVTCKADAAALCVTCDRDIHSANLLASRHERVPITPSYDSVNSAVKYNGVVNFFDDVEGGDVSREEAEAASWLLPNPKVVEDMDPFLDLDCGPVDSKLESQEQNSSVTDGVVPVQSKKAHDHCFDSEISGSKSFGYGFNTQCLSHNVLSSSLDVGVVPDGSTTPESTNQPVQLSSAEREARVLRYREKRKNRKFEKTIRYASRKAYAETRPRIKGRFAKRTDIEVVESCSNSGSSGSLNGFGVVPSY